MSKSKSFNEEDFTDIKNLFTNTIGNNIKNLIVITQDRSKLKEGLDYLNELLDDEEELVDKINSVQNERDSLLIKEIEYLKKIKKLEKDVSKTNR